MTKVNIIAVRSLEDLMDFCEKEEPLKFVFFWGHTPKNPDVIDQSCLSNWYPVVFEHDGILYKTAEHFLMAEKAKLFKDENIRGKIIACESPGEAKSLGREVQGFDEELWKQNRMQIMASGLEAKFSQNEELKALLLRTGTKVLVEASPQDRIWGIGLGKHDQRAENPRLWKGLNLLGFCLMEVRSRLC